jgi:hypothetical protein
VVLLKISVNVIDVLSIVQSSSSFFSITGSGFIKGVKGAEKERQKKEGLRGTEENNKAKLWRLIFLSS